MKLKSLHIALITLVLIFGGITLSSALGYWNSEEEKAPSRYSDAELSGQYDPESIKGSFSFGDISEYFEIPLDDLARAFGLTEPAAYSAFKCKDLESIYTFPEDSGLEIGTGSVKLFVAFYKNLPIDLTVEDSSLLPEAAEILKTKATLSEDRLAYLDSHTVDMSESAAIPSDNNAPEASSDREASALLPLPSPYKTGEENQYTIKGTTTFRDLLNWGLTESEIEGIIEDDMPFTGIRIRDYAEDRQLVYSTLKKSFEESLAAKNP